LNSLQKIKEHERIILGIDPGTIVMGYGLIGVNKKNAEIITLGVIKLGKIDDHLLKLKKIFERTIWLIDEFKADELAIEAPFFGKNVQSMLKLGRAQGAAIAAALSRELHVHEYSPKKIKMAITGNGNASKEQVAAMLGKLLKFSETPKFLDATDGLGAAYCHFLQNVNTKTTGESFGSWKAFVNAYPSKLKK